MRILGIDPGLRNTGWGVIEKIGANIHYIDSGIISPEVKCSTSLRLYHLHHGILKVLEEYNPTEVAIEETFVNKNYATSIRLGEARGVILMTPSLKSLIVTEYAPNMVKKVVTGAGHADKEQVKKMVQMVLPKSNLFTKLKAKKDITDALAIALCHAYCIKTNFRINK